VAPAVTLGLGSLPPERLKYASGLFNMMRNLGGAVGIAACGAILNNRINLHFHDIATHLTPSSPAMGRMLQNMTARWGEALGGPVAGHAAALSRLWHLAYREPSTLAYADAFRAIMMPSWSQRCWSRCCAKWGRPKPRPPKRIDPNGRDWRNVVGRLI
jgi:DHA2 family multidrug resistance protein